MKALEFLVTRPVSGVVQGLVMGLMLPVALANLLAQKAGGILSLVLAPLWLAMMVLTIPACIVYCSLMVMVKGPLWQYPPDKRDMGPLPVETGAAPERGADRP